MWSPCRVRRWTSWWRCIPARPARNSCCRRATPPTTAGLARPSTGSRDSWHSGPRLQACRWSRSPSTICAARARRCPTRSDSRLDRELPCARGRAFLAFDLQQGRVRRAAAPHAAGVGQHGRCLDRRADLRAEADAGGCGRAGVECDGLKQGQGCHLTTSAIIPWRPTIILSAVSAQPRLPDGCCSAAASLRYRAVRARSAVSSPCVLRVCSSTA